MKRRGTPKQNPACVLNKRGGSKADGAMLIAATVVAAIRLRGQEIKPSPKLNAVIHDSVLLARTVLDRIEKG
jgi:hypothetical protein